MTYNVVKLPPRAPLGKRLPLILLRALLTAVLALYLLKAVEVSQESHVGLTPFAKVALVIVRRSDDFSLALLLMGIVACWGGYLRTAYAGRPRRRQGGRRFWWLAFSAAATWNLGFVLAAACAGHGTLWWRPPADMRWPATLIVTLVQRAEFAVNALTALAMAAFVADAAQFVRNVQLRRRRGIVGTRAVNRRAGRVFTASLVWPTGVLVAWFAAAKLAKLAGLGFAPTDLNVDGPTLVGAFPFAWLPALLLAGYVATQFVIRITRMPIDMEKGKPQAPAFRLTCRRAVAPAPEIAVKAEPAADPIPLAPPITLAPPIVVVTPAMPASVDPCICSATDDRPVEPDRNDPRPEGDVPGTAEPANEAVKQRRTRRTQRRRMRRFIDPKLLSAKASGGGGPHSGPNIF